MAKDTRSSIYSEARAVARQLAKAEADVERLRGRRVDVWNRGRALDPPIMQDDLAAVFGVTRAAIQQQANKRG